MRDWSPCKWASTRLAQWLWCDCLLESLMLSVITLFWFYGCLQSNTIQSLPLRRVCSPCPVPFVVTPQGIKKNTSVFSSPVHGRLTNSCPLLLGETISVARQFRAHHHIFMHTAKFCDVSPVLWMPWAFSLLLHLKTGQMEMVLRNSGFPSSGKPFTHFRHEISEVHVSVVHWKLWMKSNTLELQIDSGEIFLMRRRGSKKKKDNFMHNLRWSWVPFYVKNGSSYFWNSASFFVYMKQSQWGRAEAELFFFTFFSQICATHMQMPVYSIGKETENLVPKAQVSATKKKFL